MKDMKIVKWWNETFKSGAAKIEETTQLRLKIFVGDKYVASLTHEENEYQLTYRPAFFEVGIPPFNPEDFASGEEPKADKVYRNKELWFVFLERISTLDRKDFAAELAKLGLTKDSEPLLLLGHLGKVSISKPWRLELLKKAD